MLWECWHGGGHNPENASAHSHHEVMSVFIAFHHVFLHGGAVAVIHPLLERIPLGIGEADFIADAELCPAGRLLGFPKILSGILSGIKAVLSFVAKGRAHPRRGDSVYIVGG